MAVHHPRTTAHRRSRTTPNANPAITTTATRTVPHHHRVASEDPAVTSAAGASRKGTVWIHQITSGHCSTTGRRRGKISDRCSNVFISVRTVMIGHFMGSGLRAKLHGEHSIRIQDDVSIGPNVVILPNVTIGQGAVVAAGSVVSASVPPLTMVQGNPARPIARCGVPLMGNSYEKFINSLTLLDTKANT